ncbi:MAG: SIMPL domain-containing protein [Anaerolineales bacterium]|nr:SIMPL domain-containing protein [Anaerolineales bacterium]MDW8446481.1 SIMPL domain-containing protein [Anaerolineales bacterium]
MRTYSLLTLILIGALLLTGCASGQAFAQTPGTPASEGTPRTLSVTGTGKSYLEPDIAYIYIGVHTENAEAGKAVTENTTRSQKVIEALKKFNIADKDIQTTNFSIYPQQQFDSQGKVTGVIYVVDNTVYVALRDLSKIGELLDAVVNAGANNISGITFDVEDKSAALSEARAAAMADARRQAEELAKAAGVTLGEIMNISTYASIPTPYPIYAGRGGGDVMMQSPVPISPGQTILQVDVSVTYALK